MVERKRFLPVNHNSFKHTRHCHCFGTTCTCDNLYGDYSAQSELGMPQGVNGFFEKQMADIQCACNRSALEFW